MLFFLSGISILPKASTIGGERETYLDPGEKEKILTHILY